MWWLDEKKMLSLWSKGEVHLNLTWRNIEMFSIVFYLNPFSQPSKNLVSVLSSTINNVQAPLLHTHIISKSSSFITSRQVDISISPETSTLTHCNRFAFAIINLIETMLDPRNSHGPSIILLCYRECNGTFMA